MNPLLVLASSIVGYLLGSVSFARLMVRFAAPGRDLGSGMKWMYERLNLFPKHPADRGKEQGQ
jgi:hypothetical protein